MTADLQLASPLNLLPKAIREPFKPAQAIVAAWLLTFPISIVLAALISFLIPDAAEPQFPFRGLELLIRIVLVAPAIETLLMGAILLILLQFVRPTVAILATALLAGLAHSFSPNGVAIWGLVIWWPFLIFSTLFVVWRERSLVAAFAMPALAHALHNLPTAIFIASGVKV